MAPGVLVLDGGSSAAVTAVRSLGRAGYQVFAPEGSRSARSRYASGTIDVPSAAAAPELFVERIVEACAARGAAAVLPGTDVEIELCWEHVDRLGGAAVIGGDLESVRRFLDKAEALAAAESVGSACLRGSRRRRPRKRSRPPRTSASRAS
jgi:biotin carboxylase